MKEAKDTFHDLIIGIAIYTVVVCIVGGIFVDNKLTFIAGVVYGAVIAGLLAYHMLRSLETTLDLNPDDAVSHARKMAMLRMGIMAIAVGVALFLSTVLNILGVLLGILALKLAAYLQPIIRRYITTKIYSKGR